MRRKVLVVFSKRVLGILGRRVLTVLKRRIISKRSKGSDGSFDSKLSKDHTVIFWIPF